MSRPLPASIRWLLSRLPAEWRESIEGDLHEERSRRRARGRSVSTLWLTGAAVQAILPLAIERARLRSRRATATRSSPMRGLTTDLRHAAKRLVRQPGYTALAVLTMAIGIGATTAVFTLANWVLFRPVPGVADEGRLVTIGWGTPQGIRGPYPFPDLQQLRAQVTALSALAGWTSADVHAGRSGATPARVSGEVVTGNYFSVVGQPIARGRGFAIDAADRVDAPQEAVISDRLRQRLFDGGAEPVGATLVVNAHPFTIVGVTVPGFHGASRTGAADIWLPIGQYLAAMPQYPPTALTSRRPPLLFDMAGRLAPGATRADVTAQTDRVRAGLAAEFPNDRRLSTWQFIVHPGIESRAWVRAQMTRTLGLLAGFVALLLILTCANVTSLMLARASEVRGEMATRLALGASRWRVARLLLAESLTLSVVAAIAAIGAAVLVSRALEGTPLMQGVPPIGRAEVDWRVLGFAAAIASFVAIVAGVLPAMRGSRFDVRAAMAASGRTHTGDRRRAQRALTVMQVAVSLSLLIGAALLTRSMLARLSLDPGYDASTVLSFSIDPGLQGGDEARQQQTYRDLLDRVRQIPGVRGAGLAWLQLFGQGAAGAEFVVAGGSDAVFEADSNMVSSGFFDALGLPIVLGRDFTDDEFLRRRSADGVAILTESLARRAFGTAPAVGRRIRMSYPEGREWTVVGVVRDTRVRRLAAESPGVLFEPFNQTFHSGRASVVVGLGAPLDAVMPAIREQVAAVDPALPLYDIATVEEVIRLQFSNDLLVMRVTMAFAVLATLLAAVGLYGVLTRSVAARRRELGIRAALGASPAGVAVEVLRESTVMLVIGLLVGAPLAAGLARFVASRLFGVTTLDPVSIGAAVGVVALVTLAASAMPARRAARVDPVEVLR